MQGAQNIKIASLALAKDATKRKARVSPRRATYFWLGSRQTYTLRSGALRGFVDVSTGHIESLALTVRLSTLPLYYYYNTLSVICQEFF